MSPLKSMKPFLSTSSRTKSPSNTADFGKPVGKSRENWLMEKFLKQKRHQRCRQHRGFGLGLFGTTGTLVPLAFLLVFFAFLVFLFSCFLTFLFSFINSHHWVFGKHCLIPSLAQIFKFFLHFSIIEITYTYVCVLRRYCTANTISVQKAHQHLMSCILSYYTHQMLYNCFYLSQIYCVREII